MAPSLYKDLLEWIVKKFFPNMANTDEFCEQLEKVVTASGAPLTTRDIEKQIATPGSPINQMAASFIHQLSLTEQLQKIYALNSELKYYAEQARAVFYENSEGREMDKQQEEAWRQVVAFNEQLEEKSHHIATLFEKRNEAFGGLFSAWKEHAEQHFKTVTTYVDNFLAENNLELLKQEEKSQLKQVIENQTKVVDFIPLEAKAEQVVNKANVNLEITLMNILRNKGLPQQEVAEGVDTSPTLLPSMVREMSIKLKLADALNPIKKELQNACQEIENTSASFSREIGDSLQLGQNLLNALPKENIPPPPPSPFNFKLTPRPY